LANWRLVSAIFKAGDDLRQEQLAMQLIKQFDAIWRAAGVPLWLYPYEVLATSSATGVLETVPDTLSLDGLKKTYPACPTLLDYFVFAHGPPSSPSFRAAQTAFVQSLAAYSLVTYFLQIKDRHNGNILLDGQGHLIHIDYGFMLTSSPGKWGFETAPFKLTREFVAVMGGRESDMFHYYKVLLVQGFLTVRKEHSALELLVRLMDVPGSTLGCFSSSSPGHATSSLSARFALSLTERACVDHVLGLVVVSLDHWKTRYYDSFQWYSNSISYA
jgi:phosphatidylinositol 4-kinase